MKTFKQFMENIAPKMMETKPDNMGVGTIQIRTPDVIKQGVDKFRKSTGFNLPIPLVKKKVKSKVKTT